VGEGVGGGGRQKRINQDWKKISEMRVQGDKPSFPVKGGLGNKCGGGGAGGKNSLWGAVHEDNYVT